MLQQAIVLFLVFSPLQPYVPHKAPPSFWKPLKQLALTLEVVGPNERWIDDYRSEVGYVRRHWRDLKSCPPLGDCQMLPEQAVAKSFRSMNGGYYWLLYRNFQTHVHLQEEYAQAIKENHELAFLWESIETARNPNNSWVSRRQALKAIKSQVGSEAYYGAKFPPPVPLWRFVQK